MPRSITDNAEILAALNKVGMLASVSQKTRDEWLKGFVDQGGKRSGPLVRLRAYSPKERVLEENEWGGNSFLILVEGALDVYMTDAEAAAENKVNEILPGESFGEMSLFAGVPRTASVVAAVPGNPASPESQVLEIMRPAFREAKKAQQFIDELAHIYERRGLDTAIEQIRQSTADIFTLAQLDELQGISAFKVFGRSHLLFGKDQAVEKVYLIKNGWVRLSGDTSYVADAGTGWAKVGSEGLQSDFLGAGNFMGIESLATSEPVWKYNATVMLRTEVMEIDLALLGANPELCDTARKAFARFSLHDSQTLVASARDREALEATEEMITTGIVEAENVLVMDMDLCIRCGNCSFACEKVQRDGRSRLVRRGIHIERAPQTRPQSIQHILVPEVCIHCQDPACLTACPTGAIARQDRGQIDIEAKTCTGCFACARLCPYNAISMVPEKPGPQVRHGLGLQLTSWLGFTPPILPAPVTSTKNEESLIAAKCNLCADTPLNPSINGVGAPAYSCEENCPTGALVRVNPREYFDEVQTRLGLVFQSPTMAVGRNIHRSDPLRQWCHLLGALLILIILSGELWMWWRYGFAQRLGALPLNLRWLTGLAGFLAIIGTMGYSGRRRIYKRRVGPLRYWMLAHVYLGAVAGVTILLHGAGHGGGPLTTSLMIAFDLVLLTGLFGLTAYYAAPRMLTSIEGDPILLEDLKARRAELSNDLAELSKRGDGFRQLLDGPMRRFGSRAYLLRQFWGREELSAMLADARQEYQAAGGQLGKDQKGPFVEAIEKLATLRRLDALICLHRLLQVWLPPHIIAASLMLALLLIHIVQVTLFAVR